MCIRDSLSDARGRKVDFRNAIIVMTSNVGADMIKRQTSLGFTPKLDEQAVEKSAYEDMRKKLMESLRRVFKPEFINRLDSVIVFRALTRENLNKIVSLEINKVAIRLAEHNVVLKASQEALNMLADQGYDPDMGARPLRRVIQQKVEDPLSDALLSGRFHDGDTILVDLKDDEIFLHQPEGEAAPDPAAQPV